jgi:hypothetical protein
MGYSILRYREIPLYMLHLSGTVSKGNQVNIPEVGRGFVVTLTSLETSVQTPGRVIFSF